MPGPECRLIWGPVSRTGAFPIPGYGRALGSTTGRKGVKIPMKGVLEDLCDVSAQVLCLSATPPLIKTARIVRSEDGNVELDLDDPEAAFQEGLHVVLAGGEETPFRIMGIVTGVDGRRLQVKTERVMETDKRDFPRLQGGISVRYRVLGEQESPADAEAWVAGKDLTTQAEWRVPDPFMDFSGSGLRFDDRLCCGEGDLLLVEMQVPPSGNRWRATARVVRLTPVGKEEAQDAEPSQDAPTHHIAVAFEHVPGEATEALAAFTLRIQDALLKI